MRVEAVCRYCGISFDLLYHGGTVTAGRVICPACIGSVSDPWGRKKVGC